ncbi:MAG: hypothetical protein HY298_14345 [Verrucomicrobia bacterium]|nr:hypothetical protein [Verrucomicrobiota bacterium]
MTSTEIFDKPENRVLLVVCARKQIRNIGIGGLIWGILNTLIGAFAIEVNAINIGLLLLGLLMLGAGILALRKPSLNAILLEAFVSLCLFVWNILITFLEVLDKGPVRPQGIIFPAIIAAVFFNEYKKLRHLKEMIASMAAEDLKRAKTICKELQKKKVRKEPNIAESADKKFRFALTGDRVFCFRRDMLRAFYVSTAEFQSVLGDFNKKKLLMTVEHPLGKLKHSFNKKNSDKIKGWFAAGPRMGLQA